MKISYAALVTATVCSCGPTRAEPAEDRAAWQTKIFEAKARAKEKQDKARSELERLKAEALKNPVSLIEQYGQRSTQAVLDDPTLRPGDIVSTSHGMFVFVAAGPGGRGASGFVPVAPHSLR